MSSRCGRRRGVRRPPRPGRAGADVVGDAAHGRRRPGPAGPWSARRHRGARRPGQRAALLAEVEVEPLERVRLQPRQPGRHRPAGRPAGPEPGRALRPRRPRSAPRRRPRTRRRARRPGPCWSVGRLAGAGHRRHGRGGGLDVGLEPQPGGLLGAGPLGRSRPCSCFHADAVPGADGEHRTLPRPSASSRRRTSATIASRRSSGHRVDVVEHHQHHVGVAGERLEVAVVDRRVGVLLRVQHPHQQVGELDQPVDLEVVGHLGGVVVGQVEQHGAVEPLVLAAGVEHRVAGDLVPRGDAEPLEQLGRALRSPTRRRWSRTSWAGVRRPRRARAR